jgi:hypothetical protein
MFFSHSAYFAEVIRAAFCGFCTPAFAELHSSGVFLFSHTASLEQAVAVCHKSNFAREIA